MYSRQLFVCGLIISCIIILSQCIGRKVETDIRGEQYAVATSCATCHKSIWDTYLASAHNNTSGLASISNVSGSFLPPDNVFHYSNGSKVTMEQRDSGLFQGTYRFDITIGSGRKAQTYLYWKEGKYFQLPVSYFVPARQWANSPGFPATHPKFDRLIPGTCFGCHSSMVALKEVKMEKLHIAEEFERNKMVFGIDCQRCHGPAAEHVQFHTEHPEEKDGRYMVRVRALGNQQQLDMCAICHSGLKTPQKAPFGFRPGDALSDYFYPDLSRPVKATEMDVHGNQYQLLSASECFIKSKGIMNCSTCHDPHTNERSNMQVFSRRCMNCHRSVEHKNTAVLTENCIDCHMPALPSSAITLLTKGQASPTPDSVRTHLIAIYTRLSQ
ncbi:multiheme c-type cytochrome [Chitinophaga niabensis]|uniref:Cytochrome c554 and c-prime n=1 Tax=Chitinophaga niabensis TaxID=536979 RepID=A0A1N6KDR2_9BACT|nr:multiheme c-type cytochrome [Chitinophaga niabensis]SIO54692.1 Cytochrome c554 and c-prime [Chitinophaga niabensis]